MDLHPPTLALFAALLAALSAAALSLSGRAHANFRGQRWWMIGLWSIAGGLALHPWLPRVPALEALAHLPLLVWPMLMLRGVREFDARVHLARGPRADLALAGGAALASLAAEGTDPGSVMSFAVATAAAGVLCAYASVLLITARAAGAPRLMQHFGGLFGLVAAALVLHGLAVVDRGAAPPDPAQAHALVLGLAAAAFAHVAMHAMYMRTARELRESRRRLRALANTDMLTRVPNRRHFLELARRALERSDPASAAMVMLDIDHFKRINDLMGHAAGDRALRLVSRCMTEVLRQHDVAGRHGGDEFALLLPRTRAEDAMGVAARIVHRVQATAPARSDEPGLPRLSLSFGVVQMKAGESVDEALRRADQALYEAKRQGRGRAVVAQGVEERPVFTESQRLGLTPR